MFGNVCVCVCARGGVGGEQSCATPPSSHKQRHSLSHTHTHAEVLFLLIDLASNFNHPHTCTTLGVSEVIKVGVRFISTAYLIAVVCFCTPRCVSH